MTAALAAAAALPHVTLADALELCLLLCERDEARFTRAALRWHGRYCKELAGVTFDEALAVLALLAAIRGDQRTPAARALAEVLDRRELKQARAALVRWADRAC